MIKLLTVVGARPQFIKAAAISRKIREQYSDSIREVIVHTGQHYDHQMSEVFFSELEIPQPHHNLGIGSGNHGRQTGEMLIKLEAVFEKEKPDAVVVYGDTNSTVAAALAASKIYLPVIHIEAGLRSFNKSMPEEINRIFTDHVSTLLFSPTRAGMDNLRLEGLVPAKQPPYSIDQPGVFHTGDIMYDNTIFFTNKAREGSGILKKLELQNKQFALATIHRPVNTDSDNRLASIMEALIQIPAAFGTDIVLPVHPRTAKKFESLHDSDLYRQLTPGNGIHLIPAVSYLDMIMLEYSSSLIITDSGGVQKEAWFMEKPVVILRTETEWTEIVTHGNGVLADADTKKIVEATGSCLKNPPVDFPKIYGNGNAAGEILEIVLNSAWK
jgi:UDP-GlcNAc3NAcA epimerase